MLAVGTAFIALALVSLRQICQGQEITHDLPVLIQISSNISQGTFVNNSVSETRCLSNETTNSYQPLGEDKKLMLRNGQILSIATKFVNLYDYIPPNLHVVLANENEYFSQRNYTTVAMEFKRTKVEFSVAFDPFPAQLTSILQDSDHNALFFNAVIVTTNAPDVFVVDPSRPPLLLGVDPCTTFSPGYNHECMAAMETKWNRVGEPPTTFCLMNSSDDLFAARLMIDPGPSEFKSVTEAGGKVSSLKFEKKRIGMEERLLVHFNLTFEDWTTGFPSDFLMGHGNDTLGEIHIDLHYDRTSTVSKGEHHIVLQLGFGSLVGATALLLLVALSILACGRTKKVFSIAVWDFWRKERQEKA